MSSQGKAAKFLVFILVFSSLVLAGAGFYLLQQEKTKNINLQKDLENVRRTQAITQAQLDESKKKIQDIELKLKEAKLAIDKLNSDLAQEKSAKTEALASIDLLRADLEQRKGVALDLEKKLAQTQTDMKNLQAELIDLEAKKAALEAKIKDLEAKHTGTQDIELGKIVVSPESAPLAESDIQELKEEKDSVHPDLEGKVLVVQKEYDFAVINLGSKDGVKTVDKFAIYHNNKYLGDAQVEKLSENMSAIAFIIDPKVKESESLKNKVSEGDRVVRKD